MQYPAVLRSLIGMLPIPVNIDGAGRELLLRVLDPAFHGEDDRGLTLHVDDWSLRLDLSQPNERLLQYAFRNVLATYDRSPLGRLIRRLMRSADDVFVDIGANLGIYSLLARKAGGDAILFEPEPIHCAFLQRNAHAFGTVYPYALSDFSGSAEFHVGKRSKPGVSSLVNFDAGSEIYASSVQVPVRTFDEVAEANAIDASRVKLIKIDVEGNETQTVAGMTRFLSNARAGAIWCEVRGPTSGRATNSYRDVSEQLNRAGYAPYLFTRDKPRPFDPSRERLRRVFDLLFFQPDDPALRELATSCSRVGGPAPW